MSLEIKIFRMDEECYQFWAARSAKEAYDHMVSLQGLDEDNYPFEQVYEMSNDELDTWKISFDDDSIIRDFNNETVTFRQYLDRLIELEVEFPRFFAGQDI